MYTTNYDAVMETYWEGIAQINDLWRQEAGGKTLDVRKYEADVLNLVKLRGSLDWFGLSDGTIVKLDRFQKTYSKREVQRGEFMIYPIQQKDLYLYPWFDLFWRFKDDLNHKKIWIVIGYRFSDEFILNIFVEALGTGDHRLILVTPNAHDIVEKFSLDNVKKVSHRFRKDVDFRHNVVLIEKKFGGSEYKEVNEEISGKLS
ncbi:MAG TPA: SIR2 family protein [Candidatus Bathyarchaeia archaeon]|nr:SIR2 family protein [Candidatus Bathyarchaeia archaeon]